MRVTRCGLLLMLLMLAGCSSSLQYRELDANKPAGLAERFVIPDMPFFPQDAYQCGPAALATMLTAQNLTVHPDDLRPLVYVPERQGSFQTEIMAATRTHGMLAYPLQQNLVDLLSEVASGNPVMVLQNLGLASLPQWHYAVVKGYDLERDVLVLNSGEIEDYELAISTFERTWARADYWAMLTVPPGKMPATAQPDRYFLAAVDFQHSNTNFRTISEVYQRGVESWPRHRNLLMGYGNLLLGKQYYADSAEVYSRVIALHPDYGPAHNNLAQALMELHRLEEAEQHVRAAMAIEDEFSAVYANTLREIRSLSN